jgi:hypothetical protein
LISRGNACDTIVSCPVDSYDAIIYSLANTRHTVISCLIYWSAGAYWATGAVVLELDAGIGIRLVTDSYSERVANRGSIMSSGEVYQVRVRVRVRVRTDVRGKGTCRQAHLRILSPSFVYQYHQWDQ